MMRLIGTAGQLWGLSEKVTKEDFDLNDFHFYFPVIVKLENYKEKQRWPGALVLAFTVVRYKRNNNKIIFFFF